MTAPDRIVLDTSAYVFLAHGHREVQWLVRDAITVFLPVTVVGELGVGFALGSRRAENERKLADFVARPFVEVLEVTTATARHYVRICAALRRGGNPISVNDAWIAAAAMDCGGRLVTFDRDFLRVAGLDCALLTAD